MLAAQEGHTSLVGKLLEQHGAPIDQHAHDGKTAIRYYDNHLYLVTSAMSYVVCKSSIIVSTTNI